MLGKKLKSLGLSFRIRKKKPDRTYVERGRHSPPLRISFRPADFLGWDQDRNVFRSYKNVLRFLKLYVRIDFT